MRISISERSENKIDETALKEMGLAGPKAKIKRNIKSDQWTSLART